MTNEQLSVLMRHLCRDVNGHIAQLSIVLIDRGVPLNESLDLLLPLQGLADTLMRNAEELMVQK